MKSTPPFVPRLDLLVLLAAFCSLVAIGWVGFIASDDVTFARGAYGWIEQFPYVGGHGTIRYPLTIPMAISFLTVGHNEVAMALPSLLYMLGALAIAWWLVANYAGRRAASLSLILAITCPLFVILASIANCDMAELFFQMGSIALFLTGLERERPARLFFFAGTMAGLGFLTRETSIFIALFYAPLFLTGYRQKRFSYLWIAAGFFAVWLIEIIYLWLMTGDPLYRINISLHHDSTIDRSIDLAGNLIIHPAIDPLLVLLFNQEFMFLYWIAIPAGIWLITSPDISRNERAFVRLIAWYGLVIFLASGAAVTLLPLNPRYFAIPTLVACLLLGIAAAKWWERGRSMLVIVTFAGLLVANGLGIMVENRSSIFGPRTYAQIAAQSDEPVHTDPMTRYRADILLKWNGAEARAIAAPPRTNLLYVWNPAFAAEPNPKMNAVIAPRYARPEGKVVKVYRPPLGILAQALKGLGVEPLLPEKVRHKLTSPHPAVELIRVAERPLG